MSAAWEGLLNDDAERRRVDALAAVLAARFGGVSESVLRVQAAQLLSSAETASQHVTRRANDAKSIKKLASALKGADEALQSLSQPSREALLYRFGMAGNLLSMPQMADIAEGVGAGLAETPFSSRENVRAIFLVNDARGIWSSHMGVDAPEAGLNCESPFADFLAELFREIGMGAEPRSAFQGWFRYRENGIF